MKDTTKLGIYCLIGIIMLVVPLTYTLTIMANNLKNIDTYEIVLSVDKLIQNIGDPRVAEKLRIYRLVEEQFNEVQAQVQKEVENNKCLVLYIPCI